MPRHEPSTHSTGDPAPDGKIVVRRDADGNLVSLAPKPKLVATTEAEERPQQPDDPRSALVRNIGGPYGAA
ncbi:MAG: hypothetical protein QOF76_2765 [Solirubrobacteraceae bacterium]|jgi:hypothetical protein|nr:hypothetical protein [Solirubrobacteraceae bacterium]